MFSALIKAFGQLSDPKLRRVIWLGVLGALACYAALVTAVWFALTHIRLFEQNWADTGAGIAIGLTALVVPILFFPALSTVLMGPMLDGVADAVEARHYPQLNWPRPQKWSEILLTTLRFLAVMVMVNLLALPVYVVLLITGLSIGLFLIVNGYLLGREYFELVAFRRMEPKQARLTFRHHLGRLWLAGAVIGFLFSVPLVNLAAPVIGTAFMVHLFQSLRKQTESL